MEGTQQITVAQLKVGQFIAEPDGYAVEVLAIEELPNGRRKCKLDTALAVIYHTMKNTDRVRVIVEDFSNGESMAHAN